MNATKKTKLLVLSTLTAVAATFAACAKLAPTTESLQSDTVSFMSTTFQIPLPNNAYSASQSSDILASGTNVTQLAALVDLVALPLKETVTSLGKTIREGTRTDGSLNISLASVSSQLSGVRDDTAKTIAWTYKLGSRTHFQGSTSLLPGTGDITFPASTISASVVVHWDFTTVGGQAVNTVTVTHSTTGFLTFKESYSGNSSTPSVELTGRVSGANVTGKWDATGGKFTDITGTARCWGSQRQDAVCPASTSGN